jgi:hypothetical protein
MNGKKPSHKVCISALLYGQIEDIARKKGLTVDQQVSEWIMQNIEEET